MNVLKALEASISNVAGFAVSLTIRGERHFTASADGNRVAELAEAVNGIAGVSVTDSEYDSFCEFSCVFFEV